MIAFNPSPAMRSDLTECLNRKTNVDRCKLLITNLQHLQILTIGERTLKQRHANLQLHPLPTGVVPCAKRSAKNLIDYPISDAQTSDRELGRTFPDLS